MLHPQQLHCSTHLSVVLRSKARSLLFLWTRAPAQLRSLLPPSPCLAVTSALDLDDGLDNVPTCEEVPHGSICCYFLLDKQSNEIIFGSQVCIGPMLYISTGKIKTCAVL